MSHLFQRIVAAGLLIPGAPLIGLLVLWVRFDSPGGAIFSQPRVGKGKREFRCLKLRTMKTGTAQRGTHEVSRSAVTRAGKIMRASKLDELPQLWNILRGEMNFVGPRPCLPSQEELIQERDARGVYSVLPGITGLAQVSGIDMSDPVRLADCDAEYLRQRSFWFDLKLLMRTFSPISLQDRVSGKEQGS
ncbi:MAG: sugar transferase [Verrucomicrobiales bacterium]|nr:sugar transferase [Verrucomicrobiales bacterium]